MMGSAQLRHIRGITCILALLLPMAAFPAPPAKTQSPATLRVVLDNNYPPYIMRQSDGSLDGYLVDEWKLWGIKTGVRVKLIASSWGVAMNTMRKGHADVIDTIFDTPEREHNLDFSPAYAEIPVNIYTSSNLTGIGNLESMHGFQVGVKDGDACVGKLKMNGIRDLAAYPSYRDMIQAAIAGKIRVFCMDEPPANYLIYQSQAEYEIRKAFTLYTGAFHRAVHKGDAATLAMVEHGFAAITPEEQKALRDKWMGTSLANMQQRKLLYGLAATIVITLLLATFVLILRILVRNRTAELLSTRNKLRATLDALPDLMFELDLNGRYYDYHSPLTDLLALPAESFLGKTLLETLPYDVAQIGMSALQQANETGHAKGEYELTVPQGKRWFEFVVARKPVKKGDMPRFIVLSRDITDRKQAEERIQYLANFDILTGLPNRTRLDDRLKYAISLAKRTNEHLAVMFLDLDRFKEINDTLGHSAGDSLLIELAKRLQSALRESDSVSRQGGDEFIVMLPGVDEFGAIKIAEKLLDVVKKPCQIGGHELTLTASIGIALYPGDGTDLETLSKNADSAMYSAKQQGRSGYRFFTQEMQAHASRNLLLGNALRTALERGQLQVYYQPQVSAVGEQIIGMEALLRWTHPELGTISPAEFIPIAEANSLILPIGEWVLRQAAKQAKSWLKKGYTPLVMAVNLSAVQFRHPDLPDLVTRILNETGLPPEYLELELTESLTMDNPQAAIAVMNNLHQRGVRMSIDDFGTGYSSLNYLKKFQIYKIKIDQSFVRDISIDSEDRSIVMAIIGLSKSLGLRTIAEGVETIGQLEFLREQECDEIQGYYFSKPLPADKIEEFLARVIKE